MQFSANGKLMLFGEYLVMNGSTCFAIPLKYKQEAEIHSNKSNLFNWKSYENGEEWFFCKLSMDLSIMESSNGQIAEVIKGLLLKICEQKPFLFNKGIDFDVYSNFPREWGFGSSSTLISILSQWSSIDPYQLLNESFGGSGYDIACATAEKPIIYTSTNKSIEVVELNKSVTSNLLFIYSGRKQSTKSEIKRFKTLEIPNSAVDQMNNLIPKAVNSKFIEDFEICMDESEGILSHLLQMEKIKSRLFKDYPYSIKSLGAWGGDFIMASFRNEKEAREYFKNKGYSIQFTYAELIYR